MTLAGFRTWIVSIFRSNSEGEISGGELQQALLEVANQLEAATTWTPIFSIIADGERRVIKVVDWIDGVGVKPIVPVYLGASGYVGSAAAAVDIRGATGSTGAAGTATSAGSLSITNNNPTDGVFASLTNMATTARNGVRLAFNKHLIAIWRIGMPSGESDAFVIEGFASSTFPEYLRIDSGGNVGISTSAPAEKFHVAGNGLFIGTIAAKHSTSPAIKIAFDQADNAVTNSVFGELKFIASNVAQKFAAIRGFVSTSSDSVGLSFWVTNGGTYGEAARLTHDGKLGIGTGSPAEKLDVTGRIKATGFVTTGSAPTITPGAGLGTTGTTAAIVAGSNDAAGKLTLTTTAGVGVNAVLATITFNTAYTAAPRAIILSPANAKAADERVRFFVSSITASGFVISSASTSPSQPYQFDFQYVVIA